MKFPTEPGAGGRKPPLRTYLKISPKNGTVLCAFVEHIYMIMHLININDTVNTCKHMQLYAIIYIYILYVI